MKKESVAHVENIGEITEIFAKVKELLTTDEKAAKYRDSDSLLINRIHYDELITLGFKDPQTVMLKIFFKLRREHKLTSEGSITRARRKVQEMFAECRGLQYKSRQSQQIEVIEEVRNITGGSSAEKCDMCDGSGKYEKFTCNVCNGTGTIN